MDDVFSRRRKKLLTTPEQIKLSVIAKIKSIAKNKKGNWQNDIGLQLDSLLKLGMSQKDLQDIVSIVRKDKEVSSPHKNDFSTINTLSDLAAKNRGLILGKTAQHVTLGILTGGIGNAILLAADLTEAGVEHLIDRRNKRGESSLSVEQISEMLIKQHGDMWKFERVKSKKSILQNIDNSFFDLTSSTHAMSRQVELTIKAKKNYIKAIEQYEKDKNPKSLYLMLDAECCYKEALDNSKANINNYLEVEMLSEAVVMSTKAMLEKSTLRMSNVSEFIGKDPLLADALSRTGIKSFEIRIKNKMLELQEKIAPSLAGISVHTVASEAMKHAPGIAASAASGGATAFAFLTEGAQGFMSKRKYEHSMPTMDDDYLKILNSAYDTSKKYNDDHKRALKSLVSDVLELKYYVDMVNYLVQGVQASKSNPIPDIVFLNEKEKEKHVQKLSEYLKKADAALSRIDHNHKKLMHLEKVARLSGATGVSATKVLQKGLSDLEMLQKRAELAKVAASSPKHSEHKASKHDK